MFANLADTQLGLQWQNERWDDEMRLSEECVEHINRLKPKFAIVCGDLTNHMAQMYPNTYVSRRCSEAYHVRAPSADSYATECRMRAKCICRVPRCLYMCQASRSFPLLVLFPFAHTETLASARARSLTLRKFLRRSAYPSFASVC